MKVLRNAMPNAMYATQMSPFEGAPEEFDQTIFTVQKDRTIGPVEGLALNLVRDQQRYRIRFIRTFNNFPP